MREAKEFRRQQARGQFNKTYARPKEDRDAYHAYEREARAQAQAQQY